MDDSNNAQELLNLNIDWQRLITDRINAKPGSQVRHELDGVYFRTLPTIVAITEAVDDQEIGDLVRRAGQLLREGAVVQSAKN
jgi:hypothetical protein